MLLAISMLTEESSWIRDEPSNFYSKASSADEEPSSTAGAGAAVGAGAAATAKKFGTWSSG